MPSKPGVIKPKELPKVDLARGIHSCWVMTSERDNADQVNMGICNHEANMDDLVFDQDHDEVFYCAKGQLKIFYDDKKGGTGTMVANEGEFLNVPRGYHYVMTKTGIDSINVFAHENRILSFAPEYSAKLKAMRATT